MLIIIILLIVLILLVTSFNFLISADGTADKKFKRVVVLY